jgi:hypothetical protein
MRVEQSGKRGNPSSAKRYDITRLLQALEYLHTLFFAFWPARISKALEGND